MEMQWLVAPSNCFFDFIPETRVTEIHSTATGEGWADFGLSAVDFELITAHGILWTNLTSWTEESRDKSYATPAWTKSCSWLKKKTNDEWDSTTQCNNVKSWTAVPTFFALQGRTMFQSDRAKQYSMTGSGRLRVIDAQCPKAVKVDGQCLPDVKLLRQRGWPYYHHRLVAVVYIQPDANVKKNALQNYYWMYTCSYVYKEPLICSKCV